MKNRFANFVGGGAAFVALAMFVISPLLGQPRSEYMKAGGIFVLVAGFGLVLLYNKWRFGKIFPFQLNKAQRTEIRQRAYASQIMTIATFGALTLVGLPLVFWLRDLGWSKDATLYAALLAGIPVLAAAFFLARRFGNSAPTNQPGRH